MEPQLSNTATPKYYGEFREEVLSGRIPVCNEIELEMNRIDGLIANRHIYYDPEAVEGFVMFAEGEMTLTDGSPLHLLPTFKLWAEQIFAWYYFIERRVYEPPTPLTKGGWVLKTIKKRLVNKQYLIVARGAAKSLYETLLQAYFLVIDTSTTHQITTSPTMKLAEEVMGPFRTAISRAPGPVFKFLTEGSMQNTTGSRAGRQKLAATKKGIENFMTNSYLEIRPMRIDKLQGLRSKMNTVDEWLSGDIREDVIGAIEQGASKEDDYLIVAVSSEGTVRNGAGDTIKLELAKILKGTYVQPHVSIWHYKLDDVKEVDDPEKWIKAQPNLGRTVTYETYALDVERAKMNPGSLNDILAKRFGIPREGTSYFFTYAETLVHRPYRDRRFDDAVCALGADLSLGDDFCAFTFLFPMRGDRFGVKARSYISSHTYDRLQGALKEKYQEFINEGTLHVLDGVALDMNDVYDDLEKHIDERGYDVRALGYDPYNSKEFLARYRQDYGEYFIEKVIQGARTESVPLGEIKKYAQARGFLFDEAIMQYTMGNSVVNEDTNGNRKLSKNRADEKIDNVSALMDGYVAWKAHKDNFE